MVRGITLKDSFRETSLFRARAILAGTLTAVLLLLLIARLLYLQVGQHEHFTTLSQANRVNIQPLPPTRGLIFDRNGVVLAENLPTFTLEIIPERVTDIPATLAAVGELITLTESDLERFYVELKRRRRFEKVPLRFKLNDEEVATIAVNRHRLPGVEISSRLSRHYPWDTHTSHIVGYVGRIAEPELKSIDTSNYAATTHIGKVGVERSYEDVLHGKVGYEQVETNARGRALRVLEHTPPIPGKNLHLSIDLRLQVAAEEAFGKEHGALVAIDPQTGAVLALVSMPGYDPNLFVNGIDAETYRALADSPDRPLFNRALRGQYPPGSTVKPIIGLGGLETGTVKPNDPVFCRGYYTLEGDSRRYRDWRKSGHGPVVLHDAIAQSCDVYFYDLALNMGIDKLTDYLRHFGFGERTGIDIVGEAAGLLPTRDWKRRVHHQPWYPGETLITGIGQGFLLTTPLQLSAHVATLSSGGKRLSPQVVAAIEDPATRHRTHPARKPLEDVPVKNPDHWQRITEAMADVVHGMHGTARGISRSVTYRMAGKTGTAQVFGLAQDEEYDEEKVAKKLRDHAVFVSFAPVDDPRIAIAVLVENGGGGSAVAAPIARKVMDRFLLPSPEDKPL
ncbi:MAG: penicillin-binding protein 2 [Gammaproteobacteria bacterium]|nr:penicillin-binding protein 2 [Gammaproteobacteria bacterium]